MFNATMSWKAFRKLVYVQRRRKQILQELIVYKCIWEAGTVLLNLISTETSGIKS
jgi:hypothetical protein